MPQVNTDALRQLYTDMRSDAGAMLRALDGFAVAPWIKRAGAGHCVHNGYFHMTSGWNYATQSLPSGHWRTKDFVTVERAIEPINVLPVTFSSLLSFDGKLWRANGLWDYPFSVPGISHTTDKIYISDTGGVWSLDPAAPPVEREVFQMWEDGSYMYISGGERYNGAPPPTYFQPTDVWRRALGGTSWELRNNTMRPRRSGAAFSWNGASFMIGGRDDTAYPTITDLNDCVVSSDGGATWQSLGNGPFRPAYGRRAVKFNGGILLTGGAYANGTNGSTANTLFLNECWFTTTPLNVNSWVQVDPLPIACIHHMIGVLTIDGVETLGLIGGYNSLDRPDGSPYGTCYTKTATTSWVARTDSGFWVT